MTPINIPNQQDSDNIEQIKYNNHNKETFARRIIEALLFSSPSPLSIDEIYTHLPDDLHLDIHQLLRKLQADYEGRGIEIIQINKKWLIRTAPDLADYLIRDLVEHKKLSKSAIETLGIIAYHQPVTRTEIEAIRGVAVSKGTLDILMEISWIKIGRRRETPGRPVTFITSDYFLEHFGIKTTQDLPGLRELKEAGFLDSVGRQVTDDEMKALLSLNDDTDDDIDQDNQESMTFTFEDDIK
ncbi:MAG: segregation and condensation protein B [Alphaproteobacteria bacterium]|jgi:segregation and condensation protein B